MLILGSVLSLFLINTQMLGTSFSWVPFAASLIMLAGVLRFIDA